MRIDLLCVAVLVTTCCLSPCYSLLTTPHHRKTIAFVIDVTGSMGSEINSVKEGIYNATSHLEHFRLLGIHDFRLVTFSDPKSLTRSYEYTNLHALHNKTASLKATGGGDCAEYGLDGIQEAINKSLPNSYIFYFSDASVKESYKRTSVIASAKAKNIKIWIIGTGCCSGSCPTYEPYVRIANETNGLYLSIKENEVPYVMKFFNVNVRCKKWGIASPPKTISAIKSWLSSHPGCVVPPISVPTIPPPVVGGAASIAAHMCTLFIAAVISTIFV